jgi:hypothetical protein
MKKSFTVFCALLALTALTACGSGEKKPFSVGSGDQGSGRGACGKNYNPISLFHQGLAPIATPAELPEGEYQLQSVSLYMRQQNGGLQAHYSEFERNGELLSQMICSAGLLARDHVESEFKGVKAFTRASQDTYLPYSYLVQGENEKFQVTKPQAGEIVKGSLSGFLSGWSETRIYRLSQAQFEIRLYSLSVEGPYEFTKFMVLGFTFVPSETPDPTPPNP